MANIDAYLASILSAVYGRDVRGSIHDAIAAMNENNEEIISKGNIWGKTVEEITGIASNIQGLYDLSDSDTYQLVSHDTDWSWLTTTYGGTSGGGRALNVRNGGCIRGGNVNLVDSGISRSLTNGVLEEEINYKFIPSWAGGSDTARLWMVPALASMLSPTSAPNSPFAIADGYRMLYWSTANQRRPFFKSIYYFPSFESESSSSVYLYSNATYACHPQAQNAAEYMTYTISFSDNNNAAGHRPYSLTVGFAYVAEDPTIWDSDSSDNVTHTGSPLGAQVKGYFVYNKNCTIEGEPIAAVRVTYPQIDRYTMSVSEDTLSCVYTHV